VKDFGRSNIDRRRRKIWERPAVNYEDSSVASNKILRIYERQHSPIAGMDPEAIPKWIKRKKGKSLIKKSWALEKR
jgi:hypothetical protein